MKKETRENIKFFCKCAVFTFVFVNIVGISKVDGVSMENTLHDKDVLILNKAAYHLTEPGYKDIVVIKKKVVGGDYIVKRVIGVGGDKVEIKQGQLYINGEEIKESYIKDQIYDSTDIDMKIGQGKVFVMGDNRNNSMDSRAFGLIDEGDICGKVAYSLYPFKSLYK